MLKPSVTTSSRFQRTISFVYFSPPANELRKVMFSLILSVHRGKPLPIMHWTSLQPPAPAMAMSPWASDMGPPGCSLLVISVGHYWRPVLNLFTFEDTPPPNWHWYLVATEACTVGKRAVLSCTRGEKQFAVNSHLMTCWQVPWPYNPGQWSAGVRCFTSATSEGHHIGRYDYINIYLSFYFNLKNSW